MSKTLQYTFSKKDYLYTNKNFDEIFHLTDFDQSPECKILITNRENKEPKSNSRKRKSSTTSIEVEPLVEILVPIKQKTVFISRCPYFENLLDDNFFGNQETIEIDGEKCLVVNDSKPRIFATVLKFCYDGKLNLNLENCIDIYRIIKTMDLCPDTGPLDADKDQNCLADVHDFIGKNLAKFSEVQFDKIKKYRLQDEFWKNIYENLNKREKGVKFEDYEDLLSIWIKPMSDFPAPGIPKKFQISNTKLLGKFMLDYCEYKGLNRCGTLFYYNGQPITGNKSPAELSMKDNDQIDVSESVKKTRREDQRNDQQRAARGNRMNNNVEPQQQNNNPNNVHRGDHRVVMRAQNIINRQQEPVLAQARGQLAFPPPEIALPPRIMIRNLARHDDNPVAQHDDDLNEFHGFPE